MNVLVSTNFEGKLFDNVTMSDLATIETKTSCLYDVYYCALQSNTFFYKCTGVSLRRVGSATLNI